MYQLIKKHELSNLPETISLQTGKKDYEDVLNISVNSYNETREYMEKERDKILPCLMCIGGPEMS